MYLVHMHSDRGTILSLRFPIGTTLEYVRDWVRQPRSLRRIRQAAHYPRVIRKDLMHDWYSTNYRQGKR